MYYKAFVSRRQLIYSYLGVGRLFHLLNRGNQVLFTIGKDLLSCKVRAFHANPERKYIEHLLTLKAHITQKSRWFLSSAEIFEASLKQCRYTLFASILTII